MHNGGLVDFRYFSFCSLTIASYNLYFFLQVKEKTNTKKKTNKYYSFSSGTRSEEGRRVTESSLQVPLTISSLFTTR